MVKNALLTFAANRKSKSSAVSNRRVTSLRCDRSAGTAIAVAPWSWMVLTTSSARSAFLR
jgi:hypothetical protein